MPLISYYLIQACQYISIITVFEIPQAFVLKCANGVGHKRHFNWKINKINSARCYLNVR